MNDEIVVGTLVGLATGSSVYVWKSENFNKNQKIFLLICVLFVPLQWFLIVIIYYYNKYKLENSENILSDKRNSEKIKNLKDSKVDLFELQKNGIISESEFENKILIIDELIIERKVLNSKQYFQLKSLLESGILSQHEFNEKKEKLTINFKEGKIKINKDYISSKKLIGVWKSDNKTFEFWLTGYFEYKIDKIKILNGSWSNKDGNINFKIKKSDIRIDVLTIENGTLFIQIEELILSCKKIQYEI